MAESFVNESIVAELDMAGKSVAESVMAKIVIILSSAKFASILNEF